MNPAAVKTATTAASQVGSLSGGSRRLTTASRVPVGLALAVVLVLGGAAFSKSAISAEEASFEIVARDGKLLPETLEVPAGVKLKLILRNEGKTPVEFENLELRVEKLLAPNSASKVTVQPLKPGTYIFLDEFHAETSKMRLIAK